MYSNKRKNHLKNLRKFLWLLLIFCSQNLMSQKRLVKQLDDYYYQGEQYKATELGIVFCKNPISQQHYSLFKKYRQRTLRSGLVSLIFGGLSIYGFSQQSPYEGDSPNYDGFYAGLAAIVSVVSALFGILNYRHAGINLRKAKNTFNDGLRAIGLNKQYELNLKTRSQFKIAWSYHF